MTSVKISELVAVNFKSHDSDISYATYVRMFLVKFIISGQSLTPFFSGVGWDFNVINAYISHVIVC